MLACAYPVRSDWQVDIPAPSIQSCAALFVVQLGRVWQRPLQVEGIGAMANMRFVGVVLALLPWDLAASFSSPACSATPQCQVLNLVGDCCPNAIGKYLDCCTSGQCSSNQRCAALGLGGSCCPNDAGHYLDCCDSIDATTPVTTRQPVPAVATQPSVSETLRPQNPQTPQTGFQNSQQTSSATLMAGEVQGEPEVQGEQDVREGDETTHEMKGSRFGPVSMVGFLLLLICIPGLCCWFCWIKVLNKGDKARELPDMVDMESVSAVSTRTEMTSQMESSSACQVQSDDLYLSRDLKDSDVPMSVGCCAHGCQSQTGEVVRAPPFHTDRRQVKGVLAL